MTNKINLLDADSAFPAPEAGAPESTTGLCGDIIEKTNEDVNTPQISKNIFVW